MRKNTRNDKVLRAITIGLAAMIAATSTPITALAEENAENTGYDSEGAEGGNAEGANAEGGNAEGTTGESGGENASTYSEPTQASSDETPKTVDTVSAIASYRGEAAVSYTGTFNVDPDTNVATGDGYIGGMTQDAYNNIAGIQQAQNNFDQAQDNLLEKANSADKTIDKLLEKTAGSNGQGQVKNSEDTEKAAEKAIGVKITVDENGQLVVDTSKTWDKNLDSLDKKVESAKSEIGNAETEKKGAYNALKGVEDAIGTANKEIGEANGKKKIADTDTSKEQDEINKNANIDAETQEKLDNIASALEKVVVKDDLDKAVAAASTAASDAAQVAGDKLTVAQGALAEATAAADDAEKHSTEYTRQQMVNAVNKARNAATGAKEAADLADQAVEAAKGKETEAKNAVDGAKGAVKKAQDDAADVLKDYKDTIDAINALITTANGSRAEAKQAMKEANDAIDAALELMTNDDITVEDAQKKVEAMRAAVKTADAAIKKVTDLIPVPEPTDKDERKNNAYYAAVDRHKWTQQRLDALNGKTAELVVAKNNYDNALSAAQDATANKKKADDAVDEIDKLINGIAGEYMSFYDRWEKDADADINDLKALLTTGYTYKELNETADRLKNGVEQAEKNLVEENKKLGGSEEDQNLTAAQIVDKYDKAVNDNSTLTTTIGSLTQQISEKQKIITDCNNNEGTVKGELESANSDLQKDLGALDKKYVYSYNEETQKYEYATDEDGKPVYTDDYKKLVARSQATKSEYKCGDEVLAPTVTPDYTDAAGSKYIKAQTGTVTESDKPDIGLSEDDLRIAGGPGIDFSPEYDSEKGMFVQTIGYSYGKDMTIGENIGKDNKKFSYAFDTKPSFDDVMAEAFPIHLSNVLNAQLTQADITIDKDNYTITIELDSDNASRLGKTQHERYVLYYNMQGAQAKKDKDTGKWIWSCNNIKLEVKKGSSYYGRFSETTEYNAKKYDLSVTPTADALLAKGDLDKIDADAATAKGQVDDHKKIKEEKAQAYDDLKKARGDAAKDLYGKNGSKENPEENSLIDQKKKAETAKNANQNIIDTLGTRVSEYNDVSNYKKIADDNLRKANEFNPDNAEGLSDSDKEKFKNATDAKQQILDAKATANGYLAKAREAQSKLDESVAVENEAKAKYNSVSGKIAGAQARLNTVKAKLNALKKAQEDAKDKIGKTSEDTKIILDDGTEVDLEKLNTRLNNELKALSKFDPEKYNALGYLDPNKFGGFVADLGEDAEEPTLLILSEKLAKALEIASGLLKGEQEELEKIKGQREAAEKDAKAAQDRAKEAQDEADRAARALENWRPIVRDDVGGDIVVNPDTPGEDPGAGGDDAGSGSGTSEPGVAVLPSAGAAAIAPVATPVITTAAAAGATATATAAMARPASGVAGVRAENSAEAVDNDGSSSDSQKEEKMVIAAKKSEPKKSAKNTAKKADKSTKKIGDTEVPLAATDQDNKSPLVVLWGLLLAAGLITIEEYIRRTHNKNKVEAQNELNDKK